MKPSIKEVKTRNELIDAIRLRIDVFIKEQGFEPGWEPDEHDKVARHFIAVVDGEVVCTARVRQTGKREYKIERMATRKDFRGKGIGKQLLKFILKNYEGRIWLQSQLQAKGFYEKTGFKTVSQPFDLHGVPHIEMEVKKIVAGETGVAPSGVLRGVS